MVTMTASVDGLGAKRLDEALFVYGRALGEAASLAPKIAALQICDSLRARTKKAPKRARTGEWAADYSPNPPRYITYKNGSRLEKPLHRWSLMRKLGTPEQYTKDYYVYTHTRTTKRGKIVTDRAAELRELKQFHLGIFHAGLAKVSWNKAKGEIKSGRSNVTWPRRKKDVRAPLNDVKGEYKKSHGATMSGAFAAIRNHLGYIEAALKPGAFESATEAAANKILFKARNAMGVDVEAAKRKVAELVAEFRALSAS